MTTFERPDLPLRFELELREYLESEARTDRPDYLAAVLVRSVATRQRPAWMFPKRWLPMSVTTTRMISPPRIPWRILVVGALLLIALAASLLLLAGSRPRLPAPYGPAANGLVAYASNGDIYTVDPVTGQSARLVAGTAFDASPAWSRDGLRLAFVRDSDRLFLVDADGSNLREVQTSGISSSFVNPRWLAFSPDGGQIAFVDGPDSNGQLWIAKADGSGVHRLDVGAGVNELAWRPPDGAEIVFSSVAPNGLYAVNVGTGVVRTILAPTGGIGRDALAVSPDGSRIAYSQSIPSDTSRNTYVVHVVGADGKDDTALPMPQRATFEDRPEWSNDGTLLAVIRGYDTFNQDVVVAVVPADGTGVDVETKHQLTGCCDNQMVWAPSDSAVLFRPEDQNGNLVSQVLIDPTTGDVTPASWAATSYPAWQRVAP